MNKNKFFALFLILALSIPFAYGFQYKVEPIVSAIPGDQTALFEVTVTNTQTYEDFFTISTRDPGWVLTSNPTSVTVPAGQDAVFTVELRPKDELVENNVYLVPVKIKSEKTQTYIEELKKFAIFLGVNQTYRETVTPLVYVDKVVDPREPVSVRVNLSNRNRKDLTNIEVVLKGGSEIERSYTTNLLPLEEKTNEVLFRINPYILPGKRSLTLSIVSNNATIAESSAEYEILGYVDMQEKSSKQRGFFREENTFEIYNNGNQMGLAEHKFEMGFFERLFTGFEPEAEKQKDSEGRTYYSVTKEIGSRETLTIVSTTDYRLLVAVIVLIVLATVLYFIFRSPIIIYKSAEPIGKMTPEGLSEVKVRLFLKNRANKQVSNIRVTDTIPTIAELKKSTHVGSMDPINVSKGKKGTITRWEFASIEPYEERVIAYRIESKLKLVGGIRLPSAKCRFESKKGKERVTHSNGVNLVHKFEETPDEPMPHAKKK